MRSQRSWRFVIAFAVIVLAASAAVALAEATQQAAGPDLGVTMLRSGDDPRLLITPGQTITISIGVNNIRGGQEARSSLLTVTLPPGLVLKQARPAPDRGELGKGAENVTWNLGTLSAGALPRIFELDLEAGANLRKDSQVAVAASVSSSDHDANEKNNSAALSFAVEMAAADVAVQSSLVSVPLTVGAVKFSARVNNLGTIVSSVTVLKLTLPPKVSFKSSEPAPATTSGNIITWQLGDIAPVDSRSVAVTIAVDTILDSAASSGLSAEGLLKFTFDASTTTTQLSSTGSHMEIEKHIEMAGSDAKIWLNVEGADEPGELPVGKDVTYTITYGNFGNAPAPHSSVSLSLAEGLSVVRTDPPAVRSSKSDRFGGGVLSWEPGDLRIGQSGVVKCHVHVASVPQDGSLVMAAISASGVDIDPSNNVAYSLRHAAGAARGKSSSARGSHVFRWLLVLAVIGALLAALRARRAA